MSQKKNVYIQSNVMGSIGTPKLLDSGLWNHQIFKGDNKSNLFHAKNQQKM